MPAKKKPEEEPLGETAQEAGRKPRKLAKRKAPARKRAPAKKAADETEAETAQPRATRESEPEGDPVISVVIPAYNEAERIARTLLEAHGYFGRFGEPYEILVVDDASTDRTVEVVSLLGEDIPQLRLIRSEKNAGKGAAVTRGMLEARGAVRLFADADGATPFPEFDKLADALAAGAQVAIASRALPGSELRPAQPAARRVLGWGSRLVIQATNLPSVRDSQCGFKAFTVQAAEQVFPHVTTKRWGTDIEMLVIAKRQGLRVDEVPVIWRDREGSTVPLRPGAYLQTLLEALRIRYNALTGAYPKR